MNQNIPPQPDTLEAEKAEARQETPEAGISTENTQAQMQSTEPQPLARPAAAPLGKTQQRT